MIVCVCVCVCITTLQHMQGNSGTIGQKTLVWTCAKISRNKSRRQGNHIVESTSTHWQNYPQQQTGHYIPHNITMPNTGKRTVYRKTWQSVRAILHCNICKEAAVQLHRKHLYGYVLKSVETSQGGKLTILWNQQVHTDRTIPNNKPDIIIRDNEKGTRMLIDVAISGDRNVIKKEALKILKYKDLTI